MARSPLHYVAAYLVRERGWSVNDARIGVHLFYHPGQIETMLDLHQFARIIEQVKEPLAVPHHLEDQYWRTVQAFKATRPPDDPLTWWSRNLCIVCGQSQIYARLRCPKHWRELRRQERRGEVHVLEGTEDVRVSEPREGQQ